MESDDSAPLPANPEEEVFEFGDQTICRMWRQPFDLSGKQPDADSTMILRPLRPVTRSSERIAAEDQAVVARAIHPVPDRSTDEDDLGTIIVRPAHRPDPPPDPLARLEAKVDSLARSVETMQKTLDSIQAALARLK